MANEQSFPAEAESLADIRLFIREISQAPRFSETETVELVLAVSEACTLLLRRPEASRLTIRWTMSEDQVEIEVGGQGQLALESRTASTISLIRRLVDSFEVSDDADHDGGTRLRLSKRLP
jgi:anti-sigma regulatory factor (Ser/Thr protein kinase)